MKAIFIAGLFFAAAVAAVLRSAGTSTLGRFGGVAAAALLVILGIGIIRDQMWALGAGFLLGLVWFWAVLALSIQSVIGLGDAILWLAWSVIVMVMTVRMRPPRTEADIIRGLDI